MALYTSYQKLRRVIRRCSFLQPGGGWGGGGGGGSGNETNDAIVTVKQDMVCEYVYLHYKFFSSLIPRHQTFRPWHET